MQNLQEALQDLIKLENSQKSILVSIYKEHNAHVCSWSLRFGRDLRLQISALLAEARIIIPNYLYDQVDRVDQTDALDPYPITYTICVRHQK